MAQCSDHGFKAAHGSAGGLGLKSHIAKYLARLWLLAFVLPRDTGALHAFCADFCEEAAGLTVARFWFLNVL